MHTLTASQPSTAVKQDLLSDKISNKLNDVTNLMSYSTNKNRSYLTADPAIVHASSDAHCDTKVFQSVLPLCYALYFTMFSSIFQASFFAYVNSGQGMEIEQTLYFVRLFADLFGRPLARFCRPQWINVSTSIIFFF